MPAAPDTSGRWIVPLVFVASFIAFYLCAVPLLNDADVPWHLAAGKLLLDTRALPQYEPWSFVSHNQPCFLLSWLWDLVLGIVEKISGLFGVLVFIIAIYAAVIATLTWRLLDLKLHPSAVCFTVLLAILCLQDFLTARPHLTGYVLAFVFHA